MHARRAVPCRTRVGLRLRSDPGGRQRIRCRRRKRQPLWIHPRAGDLMLFAGLYESWYPERNKPEVTFTIVTCAANEVIGEIHDRMPVILDERAAEDWMNSREKDPLSLKRLLVPAPSELLVMQPASPLANSVKNEGPALLEL